MKILLKDDAPQISIIVPTLNEEKHIGLMLASLKNQLIDHGVKLFPGIAEVTPDADALEKAVVPVVLQCPGRVLGAILVKSQVSDGLFLREKLGTGRKATVTVRQD